MKKLLGLFTTLSVVATAGSNVVSCFDFSILGSDPVETDLQISIANYPKYDDLKEFILEPYQDKMMSSLSLFSSLEMAMDYVNAFSTKSSKIDYTNAILDSADFEEKYDDNYQDLTVFGYCVSYTNDEKSKPEIVYGTITNVPVDNNEKI
jgi:hypothetical protein